MRDYGYRNQRGGFRLILVLVVLLVLCIFLSVALIKELSADLKDHNSDKEQSTMNETDDSGEDEDDSQEDDTDDEGVSGWEDDDDPVDINNKDGKLVVVIDPGHDAYHVGAEGHGIDEEVAVLTIARYVYEELLTYKGVEVYMTRQDATCPGGGKDKNCTAIKCNAARVEYADSVDADVIVSLHLNVLEDEDFGGAIVYYPNANYVEKFNIWGKELSECIMDELVDLGLEDRGIRTQNSKDNSLYPDESLADYYGLIRGGKEAGILSVIVEHAFVSCKEDVEGFLDSEEKLKELGIADATAIAKYYGLKKK